MLELEKLLNPAQLAAVTHTEGASVIVAGAGSGKTRVLTYRIAYMIEQGVEPFQILALTFTNKAAKEMRDRIMQVVGVSKARQISMGTFHSVFSRILRAEADIIGFDRNFTIYDQSDSKSLVKHIIKEMGLDEKKYSAGSVQNRISSMKNKMVLPRDYANNYHFAHEDSVRGMARFKDVYLNYCMRCRQANAMDFDDLLVYTSELFRQNPEVLERYQDRFRYVLVDEYQDTNTVQHDIVMKLVARYGNICVVGDDAQSIYSFRGAEIDNILGFRSKFANCNIFKLEQNYRSTQNIVKAANSLIAKNYNQIPKNLFSDRPMGDRIPVVDCLSDGEEALCVAKEINSLLTHHIAEPEDIAVLYRNHAQSRVIEEALRKKAIPYKIYGGMSFYQRKEIKDVLAYLRLVVNPSDEEALRRVINTPARGIGDTTVGRLFDIANEHPDTPLLAIMAEIDSYESKINKSAAAKLKAFAEMINGFVEHNATSDAYVMVDMVVRHSGLMAEAMSDTTPEHLSCKDNLNEMVTAVHEFCEEKVNRGDNEVALVNFLNEVALITTQDEEKADQLHTVTLMTVHAAKGLEYPYVFIVGAEENLFPSSVCESERDVEEERRLMYVAITRAKERCTISYAKQRFIYGKYQYSNPSRFLHDIDRSFLDISPGNTQFRQSGKRNVFVDPYGGGLCSNEKWGERVSSPKREIVRPVNKGTAGFNTVRFKPVSTVAPSSGRSVVPSAPNTALALGDHVRHATFGDGVVVAFEGSGDNRKATVRFGQYGEKQLLLKFARLTKL